MNRPDPRRRKQNLNHARGFAPVTYLRYNWLSNRVFASGHHIVDHCCDAWNKRIDQPWTILSIGLRDWAYR